MSRDVRRIGFTGTQKGMTKRQRDELREMLVLLFVRGAEFHHGDCIGADAEAAAIAKDLHYRIVAHPPINDSKRANHPSDEVREPKEFLTRNHDIVEECQVLIAAPATNVRPRSTRGQGTWWTITDAERRGRRLIMLTRGEEHGKR